MTAGAANVAVLRTIDSVQLHAYLLPDSTRSRRRPACPGSSRRPCRIPGRRRLRATSSLKRLSVDSLPSWTTTLSRISRTLAPRWTTPSVTRQPATLPTFEMLNTSRMRVAEHGLAQRRRQQARHRRLHVVHEIVDDVVVADFDAGAARPASRASLWARTLKPMMTACEASARVTSDSVMPPTPAWMTRAATSSVLSFSSAPRWPRPSLARRP